MSNDQKPAQDAPNPADQIASDDPHKVEKLSKLGKDEEAVEEAEKE